MTSSSLPGTDAFSLISPQDAVNAFPAIVPVPAEGGVAAGADFGRLLQGSLGSGQGSVASPPAAVTAVAVPVVQDAALLQAGPVPTAGPIPPGFLPDSTSKPHSTQALLRASKPGGNAGVEAFAESAFPGTAETREPAPSPESPRTGPRRPIATSADVPDPARVAFGLAVPVPAPWGPLPLPPSVDVVTTWMPTNPEGTASLPEDSPASSTIDTSVAKPLERRESGAGGKWTPNVDPATPYPVAGPATANRLPRGAGTAPESRPSPAVVPRDPAPTVPSAILKRPFRSDDAAILETSLGAGSDPVPAPRLPRGTGTSPESRPTISAVPHDPAPSVSAGTHPGQEKNPVTPMRPTRTDGAALDAGSDPVPVPRLPRGTATASESKPTLSTVSLDPAPVGPPGIRLKPEWNSEKPLRPSGSNPVDHSDGAEKPQRAVESVSRKKPVPDRPTNGPSPDVAAPPQGHESPRTSYQILGFDPAFGFPYPDFPTAAPEMPATSRVQDFSSEPVRTQLPPWTASLVSPTLLAPSNIGESELKEPDPERNGPKSAAVPLPTGHGSSCFEGTSIEVAVSGDSQRRLQELPVGSQPAAAAPVSPAWVSTPAGAGPDAPRGSWVADSGAVPVPTRQAVDLGSTERSQNLAADSGKVRELPVQSARNLGWQPAAKVPSSPVEIAGSTPKPAPESNGEVVFEAPRSKSAQTAVNERNEPPSDSSLRPRSEGLEKRSMGLGTPDAAGGMSMAYSAIQSEFAGSGETRMPGRAEMSRTGSAVEVASDLPQLPIPQEPSVKRFDPAPSEAGSPATPSAPRLDRFAELISTEANILRQFRPGVLSAVVRPDAHSELRIELRLHRGQAEVRASLERGDLEAFKAGWPELQSNMLAQGIALLPLNEAPTAGLAGKNPEPSSYGAADPRSGGRSGQRDNPQDLRGDVAPFGFPGESSRSAAAKSSPPSGTVGGTRHLLESWA